MRIIVAGAGPAGLSCAYWASKEGHRVTVYEKNRELAARPCGEAIPSEALSYTPFKEDEDFVLNRIRSCVFLSGWTRVREIPDVSLVGGYTIDKRLFLKELMEAAESEGAGIVLGEMVSSQSQETDLLVDATGNPGAIARSAGSNYSTYRSIPTLHCYCDSRGILDKGSIMINILPYGYGWIFPHGETQCNVGVGGLRGVKELRQDLERAVKSLDLKPVSEIRFSPLSVGGVIRKIREGNLAVVGEAAGMVMPTTGEGIRFALFSGSICFKDNYEELWEEKYGVKLRRGRRMLELVLRLPKSKMMKLAKEAMKEVPVELLISFFEGEKPRLKHIPRILKWLGAFLVA